MLSTLKDWPSRIFAFAFAAFVLGQFVITRDKTWDFFFYFAVLPALIYFLIARGRDMISLLTDPAIRLILALLAWLCLSTAWQPGSEWFDAFHYLRRSLLVLLFITSATLFFVRLDQATERLFWAALIALASLCAALSIAAFLGGWQPGAVRLEAIGQLEQPILGAAVYGLVGLIALHRSFNATMPYRLVWLLAFAIIALLVYFTYSRGQLIAYSASALALCLMMLSKRWRWVLIGLLGLGIITAVTVALIPSLREALLGLHESEMLLRESYRLGIWQHALQTIGERPLFGWGATSQFTAEVRGITAPHTHNLFLGTVFQGGLVAGMALLAMLVMLAKRIYQTPASSKRSLCAIILFYTLLSVITDNPALVDSPAPFWTIFWLPVCYIIAQTAALRFDMQNNKEIDGC